MKKPSVGVDVKKLVMSNNNIKTTTTIKYNNDNKTPEGMLKSNLKNKWSIIHKPTLNKWGEEKWDHDYKKVGDIIP